MITDFSATEDMLSVVYDPEQYDTEPTLGVETSGSDAVIYFNGQAVMQITGGAGSVSAAIIALVGTTLAT